MKNRLSRWVWRAAFAALLAVGIVTLTARFEFEPDPPRVLVVVVLVVALVGLFLDSVPDRMPSFDLPRARYRDTRGADQRTSFLRRLIEVNQVDRQPNAAVRDRLRDLAEATLRARHGESLGSERSAALLGPGVGTILDSPPRTLTLAEIDRVLSRIEDL